VNDLERLVRDAMSGHESQAPEVGSLLPAVRDRIAVDARHRGWRLVLAGTAALSAAAVIVVVVLTASGWPRRSADPAAAIPSGSQVVAVRGVQVEVPAAWPLDDERCGVPLHDTVILRTATAAPPDGCSATAGPTGLTFVRFDRLDDEEGRALLSGAQRRVKIGGHEAFRDEVALNREPADTVVIVVPDRGIGLTVQSPDLALARRIADTVQVRVDERTTVTVADVRAIVERTAEIGFGGRAYCGLDLLGRSPDGRYAYVWAYCREFYRQGGQIAEGSGSSQPARVDVVRGTVDLTDDGSAFEPSVRRLFPAALVNQIVHQDVHVDQSESRLRARAEQDLRGLPASPTP